MFKLTKPLFLFCETPLHAGSGDELGVIDLPIQREKHTNFPKVEASSLKGALRESFESRLDIKDGKYILKEDDLLLKEYKNLNDTWMVKSKKNEKEVGVEVPKTFYLKEAKKEIQCIKYNQAIFHAFGPEDESNNYEGALGFTDVRLLFFPVKSMKNVFAYITCPRVLKRFKEEMEMAEIKDIPNVPKERTCSEKSPILFTDNQQKKVILEEFTFDVTEDENCTKFADWVYENINKDEKLKTDIVVLKDEDFRDFVTHSTEVITRTKINNETGTVQDGALFTEEYLPQESILYSLVMASPIFNDKKGIFEQPTKDEEAKAVQKFFEKGLSPVFQLGGNATTGKGILRTKFGVGNEKY